MKKVGALPVQKIRDLIEGGFIKEASLSNIRPASLDLTITDHAYRLNSVVLPRPTEKIRWLLRSVGATPHDLKNPLERNVVYAVRINERFILPESIYGYCNPKSSTGRNDIHVRILSDQISRYDSIPLGYGSRAEKELWMIIQSKSYPVKISSGESLSQIRFFNQDTRFDETELQIAFEKDKLLWKLDKKRSFKYNELKIRDNDGAVILTLDLKFNKIVGYECRGSSSIIDLSKTYYESEDLFEPIIVKNECIHLRKGGFYILSTREAVRVPPYLACEMVPMDERSGEFRSHYAGFIDPGWGYGIEGEGIGRPLTLELRPFEDMIIRDNQPIAKIRFESMTEIPETSYDKIATSNYTAQIGPKLAKQFKS